jgi:hypothetical protein
MVRRVSSVTRNREKGSGGGGEDGGPFNRATRVVVVEGGLGGCLDPVATGPYGGSRAEKRRRQRGGRPRTSSVTGASVVKNTGVLELGFIPNRHKKRKTRNKKRASRSGAQEA